MKICVELSGQLRTDMTELLDIISQLGINNEVYLFISTWDNLGNKKSGAINYPQAKRIFDEKFINYIPFSWFSKDNLLKHIELIDISSIIEEEKLQAYFKNVTCITVVDIEKHDLLSLELDVSTYDINTYRMLYKMWRCHEMSKKYSKHNNIDFDLYIKLRPDIKINNINLKDLSFDKYLYVESVKHNYCGDWIFLANEENYSKVQAIYFEFLKKNIEKKWKGIHQELYEYLVNITNIQRVPFNISIKDTYYDSKLIIIKENFHKNLIDILSNTDDIDKLKNIIDTKKYDQKFKPHLRQYVYKYIRLHENRYGHDEIYFNYFVLLANNLLHYEKEYGSEVASYVYNVIKKNKINIYQEFKELSVLKQLDSDSIQIIENTLGNSSFYLKEMINFYLQINISFSKISKVLQGIKIKNFNLLHYIAMLHLEHGYQAEAKLLSKQANEMSNYSNVGILAGLSKIYEAEKNLNKAFEYIQKAYQLDPDHIAIKRTFNKLKSEIGGGNKL